MDRLIASYASECDGDLELCHAHGVAYQRDQSQLVPYDAGYFAKCLSYEDAEIAQAINAGRIDLVNQRLGYHTRILDVGIGSGEFIKKRPNTYGFDVNPTAVEWLKAHKLWASTFEGFAGYTFWDVIEHVPTPNDYLKQIQLHAWLFVSVPIFQDLRRIRESKHYRPGEHLFYWTENGFIDWMGRHGFMLRDQSDFETRAGRESIGSFAFQRVAWARENAAA